MSRPGQPPKSQQRLLSQEDEALWSSVARSLQPVRKKARIHASAEAVLREAVSVEVDHPPSPPIGGTKQTASDSRKLANTENSASRTQKERVPPPLADIDHRQLRRIARGRTEIEARIDLHGMRANEAHAVLRAFLYGCHARGKRSVLVITGKGSGPDLRDRPFELGAGSDRGVLKRNVPIWLAEPELRSIVIGFTQAHARHGGEGALYVQLRSRGRSARD